MIEAGSVKVGEDLLCVFGNRVKQRRIVKVKDIIEDGTILIDDNARFNTKGVVIGLRDYNAELFPLTAETRKEIEAGQWRHSTETENFHG